jgi:xylulokinase
MGTGGGGGQLLGIDIGTTGVRGAVIDAHGGIVAEANEACAPDTDAPGIVEADAEAWWNAARTVIRRLAQDATLAHIDGIGVTGQAPTAVLVDGSGRPVRRAILWLDVRAEAEARALDDALGPGRAEAIGGNRMHSYYLGPKLAWLRAHEPEALDRAARVLQSHAFIAMRLTGEAACDPSTAMLCAPLFDVSTRAWSTEGARAAGVDARVLPTIARAHDVIGGVTREAAAATGLREGTPVVAGGGDFAASALGVGVVDEGEACLMLGTAGNLLMPMDQPRFDSRLVNSHHVGCDRWLALGGTLCGAALEWFRGACAPGVDWDTLEQEAREVAIGAGGLVVLPYFQGERTPIWDARARGVFFGLDMTHTRAHLYRALIEGIALGFRHCLAVAEELGVRFGEVLAANGAGRSALLRQALSDALGVPVTWIREGGGTVTGAAVLAGLGVGVLQNARVARTWPQEVVRHEPDLRAHARLVDVFARRVSLYAAVRECFASPLSMGGLPRSRPR